MSARKLQVEAIEQGTVIDHIPAGMGFRILQFFQLTNTQHRVTVGLNLKTHDGSSKDLIKLEGIELTREQSNQLALFAETATINVIRDYQVVDKFRVELPDAIEGVLACPNHNCISHEATVSTHFKVKPGDVLRLKCHYCEKEFRSQWFSEIN
ncbi:aspartate carbamoyltransferase regulatory subunit [Paraferrimonas sedimenticola]|uniref:Aspartate carbamoyltransferase regulatory chain n=1 Tax=Paraferrimonas sedimenticola TaxID=375674 RepID=A0AA37RZ58_9GAMM|nr:aspartate carbamoyltransferase regulatory subunit [Paraferrimonas sedimenticola]GLP98130.1 aspartate carbamoyltransferase regulatory chain [Paraferrimonas sedimenticola]